MAITVTVCVYVIPRGMTPCICFVAGANSRSDVLRAVRRVEYGFVAGWVESRQISHSTATAGWTAADFWTRHITRTRGGGQDWTVSARRSVAYMCYCCIVTDSGHSLYVWICVNACVSSQICMSVVMELIENSDNIHTACLSLSLCTVLHRTHCQRYDTIQWTILTCAQKLTSSQLNLPHGSYATKQKKDSWRN